MNKILILLVFSFITLTTAQEYVAGKTVNRRYRNARATDLDPAAVCPNTSGIKTFCLTPNDPCSATAKIFTCNNGRQSGATSDCDTTTPYCIGDPGSQFCSADPDPLKCKPVVPPCKVPGYFPDPSNCSYYYYCYYDDTDPNNLVLKDTQKQCPAGAPFSPSGPADRKCLVGGTCVRANCTVGLKVEWRALNYANFTTNRIAMRCENSELKYVHQCDAGLSLDTTFLSYPRCSIVCSSNYQKAVYPADVNKYYQCLLGNISVESCEYRYVFSPDTLSCIPT